MQEQLVSGTSRATMGFNWIGLLKTHKAFVLLYNSSEAPTARSRRCSSSSLFVVEGVVDFELGRGTAP